MRFYVNGALVMLLLFALDVMVVGADESGSIRPDRDNPHYWSYKGRPVLLLGGTDEDNLFNNPALLDENLGTLVAVGGNYMRSTLSWRDEGNVPPYRMVDGKYDLGRFNPEFWTRLEHSIHEAEKRDIVVQIEVWATFDYYRDNWLVNPFNPKNNINYTTENTRLTEDWPHHPAARPQPFVHSVPAVNNDTVLLEYQKAFVVKLLDVTLPFGNVLYSMDNETRAPREWAHYWASFIHAEREKRGRSVCLTEMWDRWDITHEDHIGTWGSPELFAFADISQNNWQEDDTHYDRLLWYRANLEKSPGGVRPMNNVKVYARLDGGRPNDYTVGVERWWRNIFAGCASTRFHRPPSGSGLDGRAQHMIKAARIFTDTFDVFSTEPRPDLLGEREPDEAYVLADPGNVYAVYFPAKGSVRLTVGGVGGWRVRWFDVENARFRDGGSVTVAENGAIGLTVPEYDTIGLVLVEKE